MVCSGGEIPRLGPWEGRLQRQCPQVTSHQVLLFCSGAQAADTDPELRGGVFDVPLESKQLCRTLENFSGGKSQDLKSRMELFVDLVMQTELLDINVMFWVFQHPSAPFVSQIVQL